MRNAKVPGMEQQVEMGTNQGPFDKELTPEIFREIMAQYDISAKALSKVLGWNSDSIFRYLKGHIPENMRVARRNLVMTVHGSARLMEHLLENAKEKLAPAVYLKTRTRLNEILGPREAVESKATKTAKYMTDQILEFVLHQPGADWTEEERNEILSHFPLATKPVQAGQR